MNPIALIIGIVAALIFGWHWQHTTPKSHVALGLCVLTVAWIASAVFTGMDLVTVEVD